MQPGIEYRRYAPQDVENQVDDNGRAFTTTSWKSHNDTYLMLHLKMTGAGTGAGYLSPLTYDGAEVIALSEAVAGFAVNGKEVHLCVNAAGAARPWYSGEVGTRGRLILAREGWVFQRYEDQSLTRAPELDQLGADPESPGAVPNVVGWRCAAKPHGFLAPAGFMPGPDGEFIPDRTVAITLQIPPEFLRECSKFDLTAQEVLRGFVADVAGIMNWSKAPRVDGYSSNGSDEREMADAWLERAYGMRREDAEARQQREEELEEQRAAIEEQEYERDDAVADVYRAFLDGGHGDHAAFIKTLQDAFAPYPEEPAQGER